MDHTVGSHGWITDDISAPGLGQSSSADSTHPEAFRTSSGFGTKAQRLPEDENMSVASLFFIFLHQAGFKASVCVEFVACLHLSFKI